MKKLHIPNSFAGDRLDLQISIGNSDINMFLLTLIDNYKKWYNLSTVAFLEMAILMLSISLPNSTPTKLYFQY